MRFDFIRHRFTYYGIATFLVVGSIVSACILPLNLGIDLTGGTQAEYDYQSSISLDSVRSVVDEVKKTTLISGKEAVNNVTVYGVSGQKKFVIEAGFSKIEGASDSDLEKAKTTFKETVTAGITKTTQDVTLSKYVNIGESFGDYIKTTAYHTLILVILAISLYIAYAFRGSIEGFTSFSFGAVTAVSLFHDVFIACGAYLIASYFFPEFKVDTYFITALLTVLGYSINDTIVVMDRIRSNLRLPANKKKGFGEIINNSINDTMARSLYTSLTVFLTLLAMYFFGPETIKGFTLAMIFGTIVGTYSSVCIAAPLLYDITKKSE